jgi:hypothetical protein
VWGALTCADATQKYHHPTLVQQLDVQPGPGLADVLIGAISIGEVRI